MDIDTSSIYWNRVSTVGIIIYLCQNVKHMKNTTMNNQPQKILDTGTLGKIMAVLDVIANASAPIRFTEILENTGQPRGTIHRHLSHLMQEGLIFINSDGGYELGTRLLQLASKAWATNSVRRIAEPLLDRLQESTGETIHLAGLQGGQVVYLDKVETKQSVRMHSQIGNTSPIYCTGVGKAMLARLPDDQVEAIIAGFEFKAYTENTITNATAMWKEIKTIRKLKYAEDREEHEIGIRCVAAAAVDNNGKLICGISSTGPAYRITPESLEQWRVFVTQTAQKIGELCSNELGPRS